MATHVVEVRCSGLLLRRLDVLAQAHGGNRSQAVRSAVLEAWLPDGTPPVPDLDELIGLLGELARMGSLPAIRVLLSEHRREPQPRPRDAIADLIDRRRARRNGTA